LHPVSTALDDIPAVAITDHDAERLRCGQKIAVSARDDVVAIGVNDGQLVAILRIEDGIASPQRVFNLHEPT
jgi:tRNA pseudouridine55 synthase